jgi:hypothetical protein
LRELEKSGFTTEAAKRRAANAAEAEKAAAKAALEAAKAKKAAKVFHSTPIITIIGVMSIINIK